MLRCNFSLLKASYSSINHANNCTYVQHKLHYTSLRVKKASFNATAFLPQWSKLFSTHNFTNSNALSQKSINDRNEEKSSLGDRSIGLWLYGLSGLVFSMVIVGGLTRLTGSGLSMVEWRPAQSLPPITNQQWIQEFDKYKLFPEYQQHNKGISLSRFKFIYLMEFSHRHLGRIMGLSFFFPYCYFFYKGRINRALNIRLLTAFSLGGLQGGIGWWMVKSGLTQPQPDVPLQQVHVSPYRLATHLLSAFLIYSLLFSTACHTYSPIPAAKSAHLLNNPSLQAFRSYSLICAVLVAITVASGAFVAGNHAGLIYNDFPLMGGRVFPSDLINPYLSPAWRNIFENSTTVQFDHRILAITTLTAINTLFFYARKLPINHSTRLVLSSVVAMSWLQVSLGVATLLSNVPINLAAAHQTGSITLLTLILILLHSIGKKNPPQLTKLLSNLTKATKL
jgi:cytochrome c oxidase assembly protein subunit 15